MSQNKVVVHYLTGEIVKGTTQDFSPNRPAFHLIPLGKRDSLEVAHRDIKAVYFVKDFAGDPNRKDVPGFPAGTGQGKKLAILFKDGELVCGTTLSYNPGRQGFFISPADSGGNNLRIYVVSSSVHQVKVGPSAEELAKKRLGKAA